MLSVGTLSRIAPLCFLLFIALVGACATAKTGEIKVIPQPGQIVRPELGEYGIVSALHHVVAIRVYQTNMHNGQADCEIVVANLGPTPVPLSTENIRVFASGSELEVLGQSEMLDNWDSETDRKSIVSSLVGILDVLAAENKAYTTHSGTFQGTTQEGYDIDGTYSGRSYDPSAADAARRAAVERHESRQHLIQSGAQHYRSEIKRWYLEHEMIPVGKWGMGGIRFSLPRRAKIIRLEVRVGDETHSFVLDYVQDK